jgi:hypothetical protein
MFMEAVRGAHKYLLAKLVARNSSGIFLSQLSAEIPQSQPTVV